DADAPAAVARIFAAKGRPADHPLIVHVGGHPARGRRARHGRLLRRALGVASRIRHLQPARLAA
ncbi:MAG: hypothetical protein B7W97_02450, partial [Mycobacterium sp. 20-66-4]